MGLFRFFKRQVNVFKRCKLLKCHHTILIKTHNITKRNVEMLWLFKQQNNSMVAQKLTHESYMHQDQNHS